MTTPTDNVPVPATSMPNLSERVFVTIDGASTKDIDDAIAVETLEGSRLRLTVAIANPCKHVPIDSAIDVSARNLGATVYARERAIKRMLPPFISEGKGSLIAGQLRRAMFIEIILDAELNPEKTTIAFDRVNVAHRLEHADIPAILGDDKHALRPMINVLALLGRQLLSKRRQSGALALYDLSRFIFTDEEGRLKQLSRADEMLGYVIVQECMVLANRAVANTMAASDVPFIYRNHQARSAAPSAHDLANTIQSWLASGKLDTELARKTFHEVLGRATYSASVLGHYALAAPAYTHITSPLRRYVDLLNCRQLEAHVKGRPLPYDRSALQSMADALNDTLLNRKEEREEGFKNAVLNIAGRAMESGTMRTLADHEISAAMKLGQTAGGFPEVLSAELKIRCDESTLADKVAFHLAQVPASLLDEDLKTSFMMWLSREPARAMRVLVHAEAVGAMKATATVNPSAGGFDASVALHTTDGSNWIGNATAPQKKEAHQLALVQALAMRLGVALENGIDKAPSVSGAAELFPTPSQVSPVVANPKGALLERCTRDGALPPAFTSSMQGPPHAPRFGCEATVTLSGQTLTAKVDNCSTKKEAEATVCIKILEQLQTSSPPAPPGLASAAQQTAHAANPIGVLQEQAQKAKTPLPEYAVVQMSLEPPVFKATVTVFHGQKKGGEGTGSNKNEAKKKAAQAALSP